jgi:hypothetical protein
VPNTVLGGEIRPHSRLPHNSIELSSTFAISNEHTAGAIEGSTSLAHSVLHKVLGLYLTGVKLDSEVIYGTLSPIESTPFQNFFNLIPEEVETRDQIPFATAVMTACFKYKLEYSLWPVFLGSSFSYQTLELLCAAESWEEFQRNFKPIEDAISELKVRWSAAASKLFSDCVVTVVGEPRLFHLERELRSRDLSVLSLSEHDECRQEFTAILKTFVDRGLEVDRPWLILLFDMLEQDAPERRGDIDLASEKEYEGMREVPFPTQTPASYLEG